MRHIGFRPKQQIRTQRLTGWQRPGRLSCSIILTVVSGLALVLGTAGQATAACSGPCNAEQRLTGLAHPPAWAAGRLVHFEPESTAASAYLEKETPGGSEGEGPLLYHEGGSGVQHTPKVYVIFWGSHFETTTEGKEAHSMLLKLYEGLTSSAYQGLLTQYFDPTGRISSSVTLNSFIDKSVEAPSKLTGSKVEEEVANAISTNNWTVELSAQFVVATAPGSTYEPGFPGGCAYHSFTSSGAVFDLVPYQGDEQFVKNGCIETGNPSKNPIRKTSKSASHEYAEAATDPKINAWKAGGGAEIADICQAEADLELPGGAWAQNQYDDHQNKCSHEDLSPPHVYAITESGSSVTSTGATLKGVVNAEAVATSYRFEFGTTTSYGTTTGEVSAGSGTSNVTTNQAICGLLPSTTYHFRVAATNSTGTTYGEDKSFTTAASGGSACPSATTGSATGVTAIEAILHGTVNPNGIATTDQFEYGMTTSYGTSVPSPSESAGSGTAEVAKGYILTGLQPSTTYHFRVVATSSTGTTYGKDATFTTSALTPTFSSTFGSFGTGNGQFNEPTGIGVNPINGNVVVADELNNRVEVFNEAGEYLRQFGTVGTGNGQFKEPRGVAVDSKGNVWVTDTGNNRVEEFSEAGTYLSQFGTFGTGNGQFSSPKGLAVDSKGNVWVADSGNSRVEEFNEAREYLRQFSAGTNPIGVAADSKGNVWSDNENATGAIEEHNETGGLIQKFATRGEGNGQVKEPKRLAVANGYIWVSDGGNNRVEVFNEKGEYVTKFGTYGTGSEQMIYPTAVALDPRGNVWITDNNNRVDHWKMSSPWPPTFSSVFGSFGTGNGQFNEPTGIGVNPINGNVVVADELNNRVEVFNEAGEYLRQFGTVGTGNGQFKEPRGVAVDSKGNVWVTDTGNNRVEEFSEIGTYLSQLGTFGTGNGQFSSPKGLAVDWKGNVWVADSGNSRVEEFNEAREYLRQFSAGTNPIGVAADSKGNVWSDNENATGAIEEHNEKGELLQKFATRGEGNGQVKEPKRLAVANGYVWVPDAGNYRVEVFNEKGEYVTKFGTKGTGSEQMEYPTGLALDPRGNVWITDNNNRVVVLC